VLSIYVFVTFPCNTFEFIIIIPNVFKSFVGPLNDIILSQKSVPFANECRIKTWAPKPFTSCKMTFMGKEYTIAMKKD